MKINTVSTFPRIIKEATKYGIVSNAVKNKLININHFSLTNDLNKSERIDDEQYGIEPGMVLSYEKSYGLFKKIKTLNPNTKFIFTSPKGIKLTNDLAISLSKERSITIVCGRYEGYDQRIIDEYCDLEISIGDYILTGGELAACVLIDSVARMIKGVVGNENSVKSDSLMNSMLKGPVYTRPKIYKGKKVPNILLSGNHKNIKKYLRETSLSATLNKREDLLENAKLSQDEVSHLRSTKKSTINKNIYIALVHYPIENIKGEIIKTSLTNLDIQDIARSANTYGINKYFITHPVKEQRMLAEKVIKYWSNEKVRKNDNTKHSSIDKIIVKNSLNSAIREIKKKHGTKPITIATDARMVHNMTSYSTLRDRILNIDEPVLIIFGTGWGLPKNTLESADYILKPVGGYHEYNHLSVRSAVAIILDRLLGCKF